MTDTQTAREIPETVRASVLATRETVARILAGTNFPTDRRTVRK